MNVKNLFAELKKKKQEKKKQNSNGLVNSREMSEGHRSKVAIFAIT